MNRNSEGHGYGLKESLFEFASSLGTVGISIGITNANALSGVYGPRLSACFWDGLNFLLFLSVLQKF